MKKGIKKLIASTLVLMMILAMVPAYAFADGEGAAPPADAAGNENVADNSNDNIVGDEQNNENSDSENNQNENNIESDNNDAEPGSNNNEPLISDAEGSDNDSLISSSDEEDVSASNFSLGGDEAAEPASLADFGFGDFTPSFPGYGGEITDIPMIGYSKYVYVIPSSLGVGAETWARINVMVEDAEGNRTQIAHGAIPVGLSRINTVGISLTKEARDMGYTIKDVEGTSSQVYKKNLYTNVGYFKYSTVQTSFNHVMTIVLAGGEGSPAPGPDVDDGNVYLLYFNGLTAVDSDKAQRGSDGKAVFTIKDGPEAEEGYSFVGWQHGEDILKPGDELALENHDSVYAVWEEDGGENPDKPDPEDPDKPDPDDGKEKVTLTFDANGGEGGPGAKEYKKGRIVSVDIVSPKPVHANVTDEGGNEHKVKFLGWTKEQHDVLTTNDKRPLEVHTIKMDADKTVYALWAEDLNDNGIPDVDEKIHYTLSYDITHGTEGGPADKTDCTLGQKVPLDYTPENMPKATTDAEGNKIIFMYWTDKANARRYNVDSKIFGKDFVKEELPDKITGIQIIANTTVYAVWSYDVNDDDIPDAFQDTVLLKYNPVNGEGGPGEEYVVRGATAVLKTEPAPTHDEVDEVPVLFAGWTTEKDEHIYEGDEELPANCVSSIEVSKESKGEEVFAIYGYDRNGNQTPDVLEHTLTYDVNGGKGENVYVSVKAQLNYKLEDDPAKLPAHEDDLAGKPVLFYGWSLGRHVLPLTYLDNGKLPEDIVEYIDIDGDETVYAVWALDTNDNGIPDVDEEPYVLHFDVSHGIAPGPDDVKLFEGMKYNLKLAYPLPKHAPAIDNNGDAYPVVLAGWAESDYAGIWEKEDKLPPAFYTDEVVMPDHDLTLYAVYGFDKNDNGIADVVEVPVKLIYDPVSGEGGPGTVEVNSGEARLLDYKNVPTHNDIDGSKVIFWRWGRSLDEKIYDVGDKKPFNFIPDFMPVVINEDTTVYAIYAYDRDNNGVPDIEEYEKVFTLSYDANGGLTAPDPQKAYSKDGVSAEIYITNELPTHESKTFKGWATKPDGPVAFNPGKKVNLKGDVTLYAVWGDKDSGSGFGGGGFGGGMGGFGGMGGKGAPKTGDESNAALWTVLAALSVMGMGVTAVVIKRHRKEN